MIAPTRSSLVLPALAVGLLTPFALARGSGHAEETPAPGAPAAEDDAALPEGLALPLAFVENRGQWDTPALFVARRGPLVARAEPDAIVVQREQPDEPGLALVTRLAFERAREDVVLIGEGRQAGRRSYFLGDDPARWQSDVPAYSSVLYRGLQQGLDLRLRENAGRLEYDLLLEPGADLDRFAVRCDGIEGLRLDEDGSLVMETALGPIRQSPPVTWQVLPDGRHRPLPCRFVLLDARRYGFALEHRQADLPVVIDPGLEWATYLGGSDWDVAYNMAADAQGRVVLGGMTTSPDFPSTAGVWDDTYASGQDVFVAILDPIQPPANQLVWATFLGAGARDRLIDIELDAFGNVVIVGGTKSNKFPTTTGCYDDTKSDGQDVFVTVLSADGASLLASTFLGGLGDEIAQSVEVDPLGIFVGGATSSTDFPTTPGAVQPVYGGGLRDCFFAKLDSNLTTLEYSTLLGGSGFEGWNDGTLNDRVVLAIDVLSSGELVVTSSTRSPDFPTTPDAYDSTYGGSDDVFVARIDPSVSGAAGLVYSTYYGGSNADYGDTIEAGDDGVLTVGGFTWSYDFPTSAGAFQEDNSGGHDGFVLQLDLGKDGAEQLLYSTCFGGTIYDSVFDLTVDAHGNVLMVGRAGGGTGFPTTCGAYQTDDTYTDDGFVAYLSPGGKGASDLLYSSRFGSAGLDGTTGIALLAQTPPTVLAVGFSNSTDLPTVNAYQSANAGDYDAIALQLELNPHTYCHAEPNSAGPDGALICGTGSVVVADNDLTLSASGLPTGRFGYFLMSDATDFVPDVGGGQGNLCLGGSFVRFGKDILKSDMGGQVSFQPDLTNLPQGTVVNPGETWYFQFWYRDKDPGPTHNLSNGLSVTFH